MNKRGSSKNKSEAKDRGKTWPEEAKHQPTLTSSQRPTSPQRGGARHCSEMNWYHKVAVCHLECQSRNLSCQCVIIKLSPELKNALQFSRDAQSSSVTLALVAPHTFLYHTNPRELREWRMQTGAESAHKSAGMMKLHEKYVSHFYTCCGPHGVWKGSKVHTGTYINEYSCPFHADFIVLILKREFADQLKDVLTIPSVPSLNENHFSQTLRSGNQYFSLIQRGRQGDSETHKVFLNRPTSHPASLEGYNMSIEDKITAYNEISQIQYTCSYGDETSPGAGIVYFDPSTPDNALVLAAVHLYSRRDDEIITCCGISLPAIFHAIAGSQVCGVIPCLSLLVGACNRGYWRLKFYENLQKCLHQGKDPEDKQKLYHWTSQLLTVCDYLSRDGAVLRLEVSDSSEIVLASINLLSALLGCFQRVIESEGVSQFHYQINRVFPGKTSERFYNGLERIFQRLYKHLVHSSSSDNVIIACVECWLKMCTLVGTKSSAFYEVAKFTRVKGLRDSPHFRENACFQRLFGDLCLAFLTHTRMTVHEAVDSAVTAAQIQKLEQEKQALQTQVERMQQELRIARQQWRGAEYSDYDDVVIPEPHPPGAELETINRLDSNTSFWDQDMSSLLEGNTNLRENIGSAFQTINGSRNGILEHFVRHLEKRLAVDVELMKPKRLMEPERLSSGEMSEGDKVELMVREWSRKEEVTVGLFHQVSRELGCGPRIQRILSQIEHAERNTIDLPPDRNSQVKTI